APGDSPTRPRDAVVRLRDAGRKDASDARAATISTRTAIGLCGHCAVPGVAGNLRSGCLLGVPAPFRAGNPAGAGRDTRRRARPGSEARTDAGSGRSAGWSIGRRCGWTLDPRTAVRRGAG